MRKRPLVSYVFYYQVTKDSAPMVVAVKDCRRPKLTKTYQDLTYMFNTGQIEVYGYETEKNCKINLI